MVSATLTKRGNSAAVFKLDYLVHFYHRKNITLIGKLQVIIILVVFLIFPECADTEQILEWQVLRRRLIWFIFLPADRGIEPGTVGWEARTLPLCYAVPPNLILVVGNRHSMKSPRQRNQNLRTKKQLKKYFDQTSLSLRSWVFICLLSGKSLDPQQ